MDAPAQAKANYAVPPVARAIRLLRHVAAGRPLANLSQAARDTGIERTTLMRLIHTLAAEGFIEPVANSGDYALGTGLIELAGQKIFSLDVVQAATPALGRLAAALGLSCHLGVLQGREILYLVRQVPNLSLVSNVRVGSRLPAHATTLGRIILAHMPAADVDALYRDVQLVAATAKTVTTLAALHRQLDADRASGLSASQSHFEAGIDSYAAPIFDYSGLAVAGINVTGPESAFEGAPSRRADIVTALRAAAREISKRLGHFSGPAAAPARSAQAIRRAP